MLCCLLSPSLSLSSIPLCCTLCCPPLSVSFLHHPMLCCMLAPSLSLSSITLCCTLCCTTYTLHALEVVSGIRTPSLHFQGLTQTPHLNEGQSLSKNRIVNAFCCIWRLIKHATRASILARHPLIEWWCAAYNNIFLLEGAVVNSHNVDGVSVYHSFWFNGHLTGGSYQEGAVLSELQQLFSISPKYQKRFINNSPAMDTDEQ